MAWFFVNKLSLTNEWKMSATLDDSQWIKLTHTFVNKHSFGYLGLVAIGSPDFGLSILHQPRYIWGDSKYSELIYVPNIEIFSETAIVMKNLRYWENLVWDVDIDRWI